MNDLLKKQFNQLLWEREPATRWEALGLVIARHGAVLTRDLVDGQLSMRAMSMVYTTLLSLVPILALGFSLLKALGVHNSLEPVLINLLAPLGPQADELVANVIGFVENIKVGVLGSLGVGLLLYAALSMIQKVEGSFNFIWRIEKSRGIGQRFGEYLSVLTVGPLLVFLAMGITASVMNSTLIARLGEIEPFGMLIAVAGRLLPYLLIIGLFTFMYAFMPNTRVKLKAAACGGLLAGILWQSASLAFASFASGATNYNAIYSGFAIVIFLLIWLYLGWLILLLGCQLAFYVQHPEHLSPEKHAPYLDGRSAEYLGLALMAEISERFITGQPPLDADELSRVLHAPPDHVDRLIEILLHHQLLAVTDGDRSCLLPRRDPDSLSVGELWKLIRSGYAPVGRPRTPDRISRAARSLVEGAEIQFSEAHDLSLKQWLDANRTQS